VEIAVGAFCLTKRHLDVNAETHRCSKNCSTSPEACRFPDVAIKDRGQL
jgi:hypothetical protein